ncbi:unnamed protein product, partial [Owenia fusiformis]
MSSVNNSIGAEVELVCDEGFYVNGSSILTCLSNGTWNDTLFGKCAGIRCPALEKPNKGSLSSDNNSVGAGVELICDDGFSVNGSFSLRLVCLHDGTWNTSLGKCTEIHTTTLVTTELPATNALKTIWRNNSISQHTTQEMTKVNTTASSASPTLAFSLTTTEDKTSSTTSGKGSSATIEDSTSSTVVRPTIVSTPIPTKISSVKPPTITKSTGKPSVVGASGNIFARNKGVLVGMIIGIVAIILLVIAIVGLVWKSKKSKIREPPIDYDDDTFHNPSYDSSFAQNEGYEYKTPDYKSTANAQKSNGTLDIPEPDYDVVDQVPVYYA